MPWKSSGLGSHLIRLQLEATHYWLILQRIDEVHQGRRHYFQLGLYLDGSRVVSPWCTYSTLSCQLSQTTSKKGLLLPAPCSPM